MAGKYLPETFVAGSPRKEGKGNPEPEIICDDDDDDLVLVEEVQKPMEVSVGFPNLKSPLTHHRKVTNPKPASRSSSSKQNDISSCLILFLVASSMDCCICGHEHPRRQLIPLSNCAHHAGRPCIEKLFNLINPSITDQSNSILFYFLCVLYDYMDSQGVIAAYIYVI